MDLRTRCRLGHLSDLSEEGGTLLGVAEVPDLKDLKFPILLDERENADSVVVEPGTVCGREHTGGLRCGQVLFWGNATDYAKKDKRG